MKNLTKDALADALIELAQSRPLNAITVRDIVAHCEASRQTFYNHFMDKQDVIQYIFLRNFGDFQEELEDYPAYIKKNQELFRRHESFFLQAYTTTDFMTWLEEFLIEEMTTSVRRRFGEEALDDNVSYLIRNYVDGTFRSFYKRLTIRKNEPIPEAISADMRYMPQELRRFFLPND